jgi:hypothetical protein
MPKALEDRPDTNEIFDIYIKAYSILGNFRNENGRIELQDILTYAKELGDNDPMDFVEIIIAADNAYCKEMSQKGENLMEKDDG